MKQAARQRHKVAFDLLSDPDDEGGNKLRNRHVLFALRSEDAIGLTQLLNWRSQSLPSLMMDKAGKLIGGYSEWRTV